MDVAPCHLPPSVLKEWWMLVCGHYDRKHLPSAHQVSPAKQFAHHSPFIPSAHFTDEDRTYRVTPGVHTQQFNLLLVW